MITEPMANPLVVSSKNIVHKLSSITPPIVAGLILLVAAGLKAKDAHTPLWALSHGRTGVLGYSVLLTIETALGLALLFGVMPRLVRWLSAIVFFCFAAYSLNLTWGGVMSCGCFGAIKISPWLSGTIDIVVATALAWSASMWREFHLKQTPRYAACLLVVVLPFMLGFQQFVTRGGAGRILSKGLVVEEPTVELGRITEAQSGKIKTVFMLRNDSTETIEIDRVEKACTCTAATLNRSTIRSGENAELKVELDWTNRRGPQRSDLWIVPKGSLQPINLEIFGTVDVGIAASPRDVRLGKISPGQVIRRSIDFVRSDVISGTGRGLHFKQIDYACLGVLALEKPANTAAQADLSYDLVFNANDMPAENSDATIAFHPQDAALPVIRVRVTYTREACLVASASTLRFSNGTTQPQIARFRKVCTNVSPSFKVISNIPVVPYVVSNISEVTEAEGVFFIVTILPIQNGIDISSLMDCRLVALVSESEITSVSLIRF